MTKNEKKLESKILDLDCYDQELWVMDNQDIINNSSIEFKSFIKVFFSYHFFLAYYYFSCNLP